MNVNYKSDKNKNKNHWQIATSRSKYVHSSKVESNTFERNRKFNDIHFELSKMFSLLYNDDQVQFQVCPRKFRLIAETHLSM